MDCISIKDLEVFGKHGVMEAENILGQKFLVSCDLHLSTHRAGVRDDLLSSVHYGKVCHYINSFMQEKTFKLIEAVAEHLAYGILSEFETVESIDLEVKKPWAPIGLPLNSVSVKISRGWHTAYIALGSNIGEREKHLTYALEALDDDRYSIVEEVSSFIETKPYGPVEQDMFLNGAARVRTLYDPYELLDLLHEIEDERGRVRTVRWGPRTLDLDILLYDDEIIADEELVVPHPDMHNRDFVLIPMQEIAPFVRHPILNVTMDELAEKLK